MNHQLVNYWHKHTVFCLCLLKKSQKLIMFTGMENILGYDDLKQIRVQDSDEPLQIISDLVPEIEYGYQKEHMLPYLGNKFVLRKGAVERLKAAAKTLKKHDDSYRFILRYSYRHPEVQKLYFDNRLKEIKQAFPEASPEHHRAEAHLLSASPDVAGHPTGGAIDVTILSGDTELDMGTEIADFTDVKRIQTFTDGLTEEQRANRMLLREILMQHDFAPFDGEWWHFSYGDREWAAYYNKSVAIYDQIDFRLN